MIKKQMKSFGMLLSVCVFGVTAAKVGAESVPRTEDPQTIPLAQRKCAQFKGKSIFLMGAEISSISEGSTGVTVSMTCLSEREPNSTPARQRLVHLLAPKGKEGVLGRDGKAITDLTLTFDAVTYEEFLNTARTIKDKEQNKASKQPIIHRWMSFLQEQKAKHPWIGTVIPSYGCAIEIETLPEIVLPAGVLPKGAVVKTEIVSVGVVSETNLIPTKVSITCTHSPFKL